MDCKEGYCWDETDLKIINDHLKYHEQMVQYIKSLKVDEFSEIEPKKPSSKLPPTMRSRNHKLEGIELHDYLKKVLQFLKFLIYQDYVLKNQISKISRSIWRIVSSTKRLVTNIF